MGKNKKKKVLSKTPVPASGPAGLTPHLPGTGNPAEVLAGWSSALAEGFSPAGARENLEALRKSQLDAQQKRVLDSLLRLTGSPLGRDIKLKEAPEIPAAVLADDACGRLFISDAVDGGLVCLERSTGKKIWQSGSERNAKISGLGLHNGTLYVCDRWNNRLSALSAATGVELWSAVDSSGGRKLSEPMDLALLERDDRLEILVCERNNHRITRFSAEGVPLGSMGQRGLSEEELVHRYSKPEGKSDIVFLEFPSSIDLAVDLDNALSIFVWDWWNNRLLCLDLQGKLKRKIFLERSPGKYIRFAGQIKVLSGPCGPVIFEVDDLAGSLTVRGPEGDILLNILLRDALFGASSVAEVFRLASATGEARPCLAASGGRIIELAPGLFEIRELLEHLSTARAECAPLALSRWEMPGSYILGDTVISRSWEDVCRSLAPEEAVAGLLRREDALNSRLERNFTRLHKLALDLERCGAAFDSLRLREALTARLEKLAAEVLAELAGKAELDRSEADPWFEALTDVDMSLFKSNGRNHLTEITLDAVLDQSRDHPARIRRAAWEYRTLSRLLTERSSPAKNSERLLELAGHAEKLLEKRQRLAEHLQANLKYDIQPQRILREELITIHRGTLNIQVIEQIAGVLALEMAWLLGAGADTRLPGLSDRLERCLKAAGSHPQWDKLRKALGPRPAADPAPKAILAGTLGKLFGGREADPRLKSLVEKMESYLAEIELKSPAGEPFRKVVRRQKEIFALKASLLAGSLPANGKSSTEDQRLLERAREISGEAWPALKNLRQFSATAGASR